MVPVIDAHSGWARCGSESFVCAQWTIWLIAAWFYSDASHDVNGDYLHKFCAFCRVSQHEGRCRWLKDDKLLRELEADSVDSEILDEELRSLELREPNT